MAMVIASAASGSQRAPLFTENSHLQNAPRLCELGAPNRAKSKMFMVPLRQTTQYTDDHESGKTNSDHV